MTREDLASLASAWTAEHPDCPASVRDDPESGGCVLVVSLADRPGMRDETRLRPHVLAERGPGHAARVLADAARSLRADAAACPGVA